MTREWTDLPVKPTQNEKHLLDLINQLQSSIDSIREEMVYRGEKIEL